MLRWYNWLGITALLAGVMYTFRNMEESYPINMFEEEVFGYDGTENTFNLPKKGLKNVIIIMNVLTDRICYKVEFMRNDHVYTVNYWDQTPRFKRIQQILEANANLFNLKYEYRPQIEVSAGKVEVFFKIISTVFITAYFLRGSQMGNVQRSNKTTNVKDMLGQKKSFDVIT
jgi:hypothetical protein